MRVREDKVVTPTGAEGIYGVMESNDSVMIAAANNQDELYLVRTFRYTTSTWNWELPGGGGDTEGPIPACKRELEEETGIRAKTWEKLGTTQVCNGLMTEKMTTYLARDLAFTGKTEASDEQIAAARFFSRVEIDTMINNGDINDGQSMTGIFLYQRWLQHNKETV